MSRAMASARARRSTEGSKEGTTTGAMLERVDRVQVAVADRRAAATTFSALLAAEVVGEDAVAPLAARRTTLRAGTAEVELLEADGAGAVADHLAERGPGLFAAGFAAELGALRERLVARHVSFAEAGDQLMLAPTATGGHGLRCVLSPLVDTPAAPGLVTHLYEVTNLVADATATAALYAERFGLATERFCAIESAEFGYRGVLTMFAPDERLDRIECITPYDWEKTMGRFMRKRGETLYMCFAEAVDLAPICARLAEHAPRAWTPVGGGATPETLFIHPPALAGIMMGVSRTTVGWTWSGHPERVRRAPA
jgi:hypothetical protein